jgi:tRNA1Val (adenine37-N6)-methyltransferase
LIEQAQLGAEPLADETLDGICGVRVLQRRHGYRFNLDPILLAHFACARPLEGRVIELGAGCGIVSLLLARKFGVASVGLELQDSLYSLARRNVRLNGLERLVTLVRGDLREARAMFPAASFRNVLSNPPYHPGRDGRINEAAEKAIARHQLACTPAEVVDAAAHLLEPRGSLWLVVPAARVAEWLVVCARASLTPARLRCVHPREGRAAELALIRADKQGRAALEVLPPLIVHTPDRSDFSGEVEAMLT